MNTKTKTSLIFKILYAISALLLIVPGTPAFAQPTTGQPVSKSLFGMTNVVDVHLQFTPKEWQKIQPPDDVNWDFGDALKGLIEDAEAGRNFHSEKSSRPGLAGYMGVDHQYGMANVSIGDETVHGVGVRYKGNGTFLAGHFSGKYSFKIDFNEYHDDLEFRTLKKVNLNNNVNDPSMMREALSYELFREAGVPASRTGWAQVYLTVDGEIERKYLGLYLVVEQVDKRFLKRTYGSAKGLLVKPSTFGAFRYLGDHWEKYEAAYFPKTEPSSEQQQRLIDFARLLHGADDREFATMIEDYLEMNEFLSFLAVNVILSNLDSFLGGSQNYYAYLEPTSNKIQLLPWDMDISFGEFVMLGTPDSRRNLSIDRPQVGDGNNRLIERVLAIPKYKKAYHERIEELMDSAFTEERIMSKIDHVASFLGPLVAKEGDWARERFASEHGDSSQPGSIDDLKHFVLKRRKSVSDQLAGRSEGQHLSWEGQTPVKLIAMWIGLGIAFLLAGLLNATAWVWAVIAGFRDSTRWGVLNMALYPITPMIYGFHTRRNLGRRAAIMVLCSFSLLMFIIASLGSLS